MPFLAMSRPAWSKRQRAIAGELARLERNFIERDAGALHADLFARAAEIDQRIGERFRADEDEADRCQHFFRGGAVGGLVEIDQDIGAVEGDDAGFVPRANERQQMHRDVAEVDVEQFGARICRARSAVAPTSPREICQGASRSWRYQMRRRKCVAGFGTTVTSIEREALRFFALLRDDDRAGRVPAP